MFCIPCVQRLIELFALTEHFSHCRHLCDIPIMQWLIKINSALKSLGHVLHLRNVPCVQLAGEVPAAPKRRLQSRDAGDVPVVDVLVKGSPKVSDAVLVFRPGIPCIPELIAAEAHELGGAAGVPLPDISVSGDGGCAIHQPLCVGPVDIGHRG